MINLATRKILAVLCCVIAAFSFAVFVSDGVKTANADISAETLEEKIVRFTNSDLLDGEPEDGVTIRDFAVKYKRFEYVPAGYNTTNYPITDILSKVVPLELFYTKGVHVYMGKEYGFVVITGENSGGTGFYNSLLIIDFEIGNTIKDSKGNIIPNQVTYRIEPLIQIESVTTNDEGRSPWVVKPRAGGYYDFKLRNIGIGANLYNENELNDGERYYSFDSDGGDVLSSARIAYSARYDADRDVKPIAEWGGKLLINRGLDIVEDLDIPYVSTAAKIINKIVGFVEDVDGYFDAKDKMGGGEVRIENESNLIMSEFMPKDGTSGSQGDGERYARNVYLCLKQGYKSGNDKNEEGKTAYLKPSLNANFDDDGNLIQENDYIEMIVKTQGVVANSRIAFGSCFEIVYEGLSVESVLIKNENNEYEIILAGTQDIKPALFAQGTEFKIYRKAPEMLGKESKAYLLDPSGYMLYKFQPKFNNKFAFGKYTFKTVPDGTQPSTRIHLFKAVYNGVALNEEELIKKTRDELLNSEYLLAYNNTDIFDMWELPYEFTDMGSEQANTYYVLYKYEFDYTGGGSAFKASCEFTPDEQKTDKTITKTLNSRQETYFTFKPAKTGNYVINADGLSSANIAVYDGSGNFIIDGNRNNLHSLLDENKKYVIKIKNLGSQSSVNFSVNWGEEVVLNDFKYVASLSIKPGETQYYKFVPQNLSGSYKVVGDGIEYCVVSWYNQYLEEIESKNNAAFLSKNQTYYIGIENILVTENVSGEFIVEYQNDVVSFSTRVGAYKEEYKQYLAYIVEGSNIEGLNKTAILLINGDIVYNGEYDGDVFVYNLSDYYFDSKTIKFTCELIINGNQKIALAPVNIITADVITYQKGVTISAEYSSILFTQSYEYNYIDACLTVPASVKVLTMSDVNSNGMRGFYINVESSSEPLIINLKNVRFFAPLNKPAISSKRDIIINCFEKATLYGGAGSVDETYPLKHASAGIEMRQNNLYLNGSGRLYICGGSGGKKNDWQVFSYNEAAGNGGTGIEVNNLVSAVSVLEVDGGYGGVGGYGKAGEAGKNGSGVQSNGVGARGGDGGEGSRGCNGGAGGSAIWILGDYFAVYTSQLSLYGGKGGNGGSGGTGGKGGKGAPGKDGGLFGGQCAGGRGGDGGKGGNGGDYGLGLPALSTRDINRTINFTGVDFTAMFEKCGNNGTAGRGGDGGFGGKGGAGGKNSWGAQAANGADGNVGENGSDGGNPSPRPYGDETGDYDYMQSIVNACIIEKLGKEEAYRLFGHEIFCGELNCSHIK